MDNFSNGEQLDRRRDRWPDVWIYNWMYNLCSTLIYAALFSLVITVYNIAKRTNISQGQFYFKKMANQCHRQLNEATKLLII